MRGRVGGRRLGVGVRVTVFALGGGAASVRGGASLAALLPHSPRLLLRWHSASPTSTSTSSSYHLIVVFAEAACPLSFADLLPRLGHGTLQLGAQLAVLEGAHLWRHELCIQRETPQINMNMNINITGAHDCTAKHLTTDITFDKPSTNLLSLTHRLEAGCPST